MRLQWVEIQEDILKVSLLSVSLQWNNNNTSEHSVFVLGEKSKRIFKSLANNWRIMEKEKKKKKHYSETKVRKIQTHWDWKRPPRPSSPTCGWLPPSQPEQSPECYGPVVPWTPPGMDSTPGSLHVLSMKTALSRECSIIENKLAWTVEGKNVFKRHAGELLASLTPVFHKMSRYSEQCVVHNGSFQAHSVVFVLSLKFRVDHECFRLSF